MRESLGLGFCAWRGSERSLCFSRRGGMGKKIDFIGNGASKIVKRFSNIRWIVVGFV